MANKKYQMPSRINTANMKSWLQPMGMNQGFDDPLMQSMYEQGRKMIVEEVYCIKCGLPIEHIKDENNNSTGNFMTERKNKIHDKCLYEVYKRGHYNG